MAEPAITTALSWVWTALTIEIDNRFEHEGSTHTGRLFRISLPMWSNALRLMDEGGTTVGELGHRACAACNLAGLERWGWITIGETAARRRDGYGTQRGIKVDTLVRPTKAGSYARRLWPRVVEEVEGRWRDRFGDEVVALLASDLASTRRAGLPWSPPEVHPSDGFYTHISDGDPAFEAAQDQIGLPLVALLGQTLTGATMAHEKRASVSLPVSANLLRVVGSGVVPVRDLPSLSGISKEGIAMATGFLQRKGMAIMEGRRGLRLTGSGVTALDAYTGSDSSAALESLRPSLHAILSQREALSVGLVPPDGCWRAERPYLARTKRMVADPIGALPWQPMVLHRGGWPDGS